MCVSRLPPSRYSETWNGAPGSDDARCARLEVPEVVDAQRVRVLQLRERERLLEEVRVRRLEDGAPAGVVAARALDEGGAQQLDAHDAIEPVVGRAVDRGHASAADPVEDRVAVEKPHAFGELLLTWTAGARHTRAAYATWSPRVDLRDDGEARRPQSAGVAPARPHRARATGTSSRRSGTGATARRATRAPWAG